jgi:hypothetical protein
MYRGIEVMLVLRLVHREECAVGRIPKGLLVANQILMQTESVKYAAGNRLLRR